MFEFAPPTRIIFGNGTAKEVPSLAAAMGKRALLVTGANRARSETLSRGLSEQGIETTLFSIAEEPTADTVVSGLSVARANGCEFVVAVGGGSVIDGAKAVAALLTNPGDLMDYLEVVGNGKPLAHAPAPVIAVPTTAGTGAEVTGNAVIASTAHGVKVSLRHRSMVPDIVVTDPELTFSMPPHVTAATGMDALTQVVEPYTSRFSNPLTDGICLQGIKRAARSLLPAFLDGNNRVAREEMALAGLFGGLALANSGLGAVHGIAGPLGGMIHAPHGALCARLLPNVMRVNISALEKSDSASNVLARYGEIARIFTGRKNALPFDGVSFVESLARKMHIPTLFDQGLERSRFDELAEKARRASSMKGNPLTLTNDELMEILERSFDAP